MQMHFLNTKLLEERCANCACPFDKKNLRATKLKVSREKSPAQDMEIQILDALAFIYETSRSEFANTLAHFIEDEENEAILPTTVDSLTVALCCQCAPILTEMYNSHRNFNKLSKSDSIISKVKTFQGRQPLKNDSALTFEETEEFGDNLFDDLSYDDNQILCSEIEENLDFRYEYDVLTDFPQLLTTIDSAASIVKQESQEISPILKPILPLTPIPKEIHPLMSPIQKSVHPLMSPIQKSVHPLTFALAKASEDLIMERKRYSGGAKIGLHPQSHYENPVPVPLTNGRMTRRMTRESEKSEHQQNVEEHKPPPAATSTVTHADSSCDETENNFALTEQGANANEYDKIIFTETTDISHINGDIATPSEKPPSPAMQIEEHSTINIEQLEELSGSQHFSSPLSNGNMQMDNGSPSSDGSVKDKSERNRKSGGRVPCGVCGQKICQDNMRGHMKIHAAVRETFKCELCDKVYLHKRNLRVHMKAHNQGEEVNCQYCNKLYPTLLLMKCHEEVHLGEEKPYCCQFCELTFRKRRELEVHAPVHSTDRPFNCEECGNNFKRKKDLRRHEKIHSDARMDKDAFKCTDCGKLLRHSFSLYKHRVKYHRQRQ